MGSQRKITTMATSKSFSSVASNVWNAVSNHRSSIPTLPAFRSALKHHLFLLAYPDSSAKNLVHKETIDKVPNSLPNRSNIELEIYGIEGIPEADQKEHEKQKRSKGSNDQDQDDQDSDSDGEKPAPGKAAPQQPLQPPMPMMPMMPPLPMMPMMPGMPPMGPMGPMIPMGPMGPMPFIGHGMPMMPMPPGMMPPRNAFMPGVIPPLNPINPAATAPAPQPPAPSLPLPTISSAASQAGPGKLLFPAAASVVQASTVSSALPIRPTFPAYSQPNTPSAPGVGPSDSSASVASPSTSTATVVKKVDFCSSSTVRLIHPEDDVSLEEKRAEMPRYKLKPAGPDSLPAPPAAPSIMTGSIRPPGGSMMNGPVMQPPPLPPIPPGMMMGNSGPMMGNSGPMVPQPFGMFGPPPVRPGMAPFGGRY